MLRPKTAVLLTAREEADLARRIRAGDASAREELVTRNLLLVVRHARPFLNKGVEKHDLYQEGFVGLIKAAEEFDPGRFKTRFSTYASYWIRLAMQKALITQGRPIRIPYGVVSLMARRNAAARRLNAGPEDDRVAESIGLKPAEVRRLRDGDAVLGMTRHQVDVVPLEGRDAAVGPDAETRERLRDLRARFDSLTERERRVVALRWGLFGQERLSLRQVGALLGVSGERVRVVEKRALDRLRVPSPGRGDR